MSQNFEELLQQLEQPLSREEIEDLESIVNNEHRVERALSKAEAAGLDVSAQRQRAKEQVERARKLLAAYKD